jgi:uncharacterized protein
MPALTASPALDNFTAVVVTGGSSGIGKSFIEHTGKLYRNALICNLSRSQPRRDFTQGPGELKLRHVACDLADPPALGAAAERVLALLQSDAPAGPILLINNAGFGGYGCFPDPSRAHQLGMIDLNVRAVVDLTARLLPALLARGGAIVNVASTAAFQPTAYLATYGATKAFVLHWSLGLREELRGRGVHVLAVCPGPTSTQFFRRAGLRQGTVPDAFGQSSDQVVRESLSALRRGRTLVVTGWKNKLMATVSSKLPKVLITRVSAAVLARVRLRQLSS